MVVRSHRTSRTSCLACLLISARMLHLRRLVTSWRGNSNSSVTESVSQRALSWALLRMLLHYKRYYRDQFKRMFAGWPDSIRELSVEYHLKSLGKTLQEWPARSRMKPDNELVQEIRQGGRTPDVPVVVLAAMGLDPFMAVLSPEPYLRAINEGKTRAVPSSRRVSPPRRRSSHRKRRAHHDPYGLSRCRHPGDTGLARPMPVRRALARTSAR
jgi:hypothetical protein